MILQIVKLRSALDDDELQRVARERAPEFRALPGLAQKYYVRREGPGEYAGVYLWDSLEAMQDFKESELAGTIAEAYQVVEPPEIEVFEVLFPLRS